MTNNNQEKRYLLKYDNGLIDRIVTEGELYNLNKETGEHLFYDKVEMTSQPSSVPVEKEIPHAHCRCMNIGNTCSNRHYADCDICKPNGNELRKLESSPSHHEASPPMYYGSEKHPNIESIKEAHPEAFHKASPKDTMDEAIEKYNQSKADGTLDEKFPSILSFPKVEEVFHEGKWIEEFDKNWPHLDMFTEYGQMQCKDKVKAFIQCVERDALKRRINISSLLLQKEEEATLTELKRVNDILDGMKKDNSLFKDGSSFRCRTCKGQEYCECGSFNEAITEAKHLINNTQ